MARIMCIAALAQFLPPARLAPLAAWPAAALACRLAAAEPPTAAMLKPYGGCPILFAIGQRVGGIVCRRGYLLVVFRARRQLASSI